MKKGYLIKIIFCVLSITSFLNIPTVLIIPHLVGHSVTHTPTHHKQKDNHLRVCYINAYYVKVTSLPVPFPHISLLPIIYFSDYSLSVLSGVLLMSHYSLFFSFSLATLKRK